MTARPHAPKKAWMTPEEFRAALGPLGMSQRQLATATGVDLRTVSRYANGEDPVTRKMQLALAGLRDALAARCPAEMTADQFCRTLDSLSLNSAAAAKELDIDERTVRRYRSGNFPVTRLVQLALAGLKAQGVVTR